LINSPFFILAKSFVSKGIAPTLYYRWSIDFIEAGKKRLNGDTEREANSFEVDELRKE